MSSLQITLVVLIVALILPSLTFGGVYLYFKRQKGVEQGWISRTAEVLALVAALVGLLFALIQYDDSNETKRTLNALGGRLTTKYVGAFPANLDSITSLVEDTKGHLDLMTDFVDYGNYSDP